MVHPARTAIFQSLSFVFVSVLCFATIGCGRLAAHPQQEYGDDAHYYLGLHALSENDTDKAIRLFTRAAERGSRYVVLRSREALTRLGNIQMRVIASDALIAQFPDERSYVTAARQYSAAQEYSRIILMTDKIDVTESLNELVYYRLAALWQKSDGRCAEELFRWFLTRTISTHHNLFYNEYIAPLIAVPAAPSDDTAQPPATVARGLTESQLTVLTFRIQLYQKVYQRAYQQCTAIRALFTDAEQAIPPQIISDMGHAFLYGAGAAPGDARFFVTLATTAEAQEHAERAFYAWFYAGRLSDRAENTQSARTYYERALLAAETEANGAHYDNALWYLLNSIMAHSVDGVLPALRMYSSTWYDASEFDNFFSQLIPLLLAQARWSDIKRILTAIDGYASDDVIAQYSYIYGRLLETGLAQPVTAVEVEATDYFGRALTAGSATYYAVLAGVKCGLSNEQIIAQISAPKKNTADPIAVDTDAERLLRGYATFGLADYLYDEWRAFYTAGIRCSMQTDTVLAQFLWDCGETDYRYYPQSLRIASLSAQNQTEPISDALLKLVYPKDYEAKVVAAAETYALAPELLFALIRSESFFDATISSNKGALGLTQLMDFTAADVARQLRRTEYDATDPDDSILFGAHYLSSLMGRLDNSPVAALAAYNAGLTRIRRWINSTRMELGITLSGNYDLFLETAAYKETRGYGRNVVSAAKKHGI